MNLKKLVCFAALICLVLCPCPAAYAAGENSGSEKPAEQPKEKWYDVRTIGQEIVRQKKEMCLTSQQALKIFRKEKPYFQTDWQAKLKEPVQDAPDATGIPEGALKIMREMKGEPLAHVIGFSKSEALIMILRPRGNYLWHLYSECLANFKVTRNAQFDALLGISALENTFAFEYKGVGYGDFEKKVSAVLGKPDASETFQAFGYYRLYYFKDDIVIEFQNNLVRVITRGVPEEIKVRVKQNGPNIVLG
jgi:hypothetical protein